LRVLFAERATPVREHPDHRQLIVGDHRSKPSHPSPDQRDGVRVRGVGLAALPGREHPRPSRHPRWHVDNLLTVSEQPHRDVPADAVASLDGPDPVRPSLHELGHRLEPGHVGAEPTTVEDRLIGGHHFDRHRPFVRIHPDHDPFRCCHLVLLRSEPMGTGREGTAATSRAIPS
jgi:hypothetical protein